MSKNIYHWKGKRVSKKVYELRLRQQYNGRMRKKSAHFQRQDTDVISNKDVTECESNWITERRLVELKVLGEQLWCLSCKEALSLDNIESEIRRGLASTLIVRCHKCLILREVLTGKLHCSSTDSREMRFDINSKAVIGTLHAGIGWAQLNKLFACMNTPLFNFRTFKRYEEKIGLAAETVAKASCVKAAEVERRLTIENAEAIGQQL